MFSTLFIRAHSEAVDDVFREEDINDDNGHDGNRDGKVHGTVVGEIQSLDHGDHHRHGVFFIGGQKNQWSHIIVPTGYKVEDAHGGHAGQYTGQHNAIKDLPFTAALQPCRFHHGLGDTLLNDTSQKEYRGGVGNAGKYERNVRVEQVQPEVD